MIRFVAACLLPHAALAALAPLAWWAPDLTVAGVVLMTALRPGRWWLWSGLAGLFTLLWTTAAGGRPAAAVIASLGGVVWLLSRQWDLSDPRLQTILVGSASGLITLWELSMIERWSWLLLALAAAHVAVTIACVPLLRRALRPG